MQLFEWITRWRRRDDDLQREIAAHLTMAAKERIAAGEDPEAARLAARRDFGNVTLTREATRLTWSVTWIEHLSEWWRDVRYAARLLRKSPGYSFVVVAVLAVGIGTNLVAFGFYNAIALAPLSGVERSSELHVVMATTRSGRPLLLSHRDYRYLRDEDRTHRGLAASDFSSYALGRGPDAQRVFGEWVSGNYFEVLGVRAQVGRTLGPPDDIVPRGHPVAVLSDSLWRRQFGADPQVVGRTIHVNGVPLTVAGVTPADFHGSIVGVDIELFIPVMMQPALSGGWDALASPDARFLFAFGRPRPGIGLNQARAEADRLGRQLAADYPVDQIGERALVLPIRESPYGAQTYGAPVVRLTGATAVLLLLVVCANVAGLVLVRTMSRRAEIAARLALGATRARLARLLLLENLLLAVPGACLGLLLPWAADPYLTASTRDTLSARLYFNWDSGMLPFVAVLLACASALLCGLLPALKASRMDSAAAIKDIGAPRGPASARLRSVLVVCQIAASLVLLVGTALALRSLGAARRADPGFDPRHVASVMVDVRPAGRPPAEERVVFDRLLERLRALPGVEAASLMRLPLLLVYDFGVRPFVVEGHAVRRGEDLQFAYNIVSPAHFRTLAIPLAAGRDFITRDDHSAMPVAIVNETLAARFWGDASKAVGKRMQTPDWTTTVPTWLTIVGVARDIKYTRLNEEPKPYVYLPFAQAHGPVMSVHVRGPGGPAPLVDRVVRELKAMDPNLAISDARPLAAQTSTGASVYEAAARVLAFVGLAALALAALGIYGLVTYIVRQSTHEIGIRLALGAPRGGIARRFLMHGLRLGVSGAAVGVAASLAASRLMRTLLYDVAPTDVLSFAAAAAAVLFLALAASLVPAWRAARLNPLTALRP